VYQKSTLNPKDEILDTEDSTVLIIGMGRVGAGAYKAISEIRPQKVLGIELNEDRAAELTEQGYNVKVADATDTDFWNMVHLSEPAEEMILLAMPNHRSNLFAAERIQASGLDCKVVAIAKHETEVQELLELGIPSFNLYREAGEGLGREAMKEIHAKSA
ncbi:MAG: NAD(P)-binding protein, partial [Litorivicinaceae bacterium]